MPVPNRLADASSPYLAQHADNPVDWFPWGDEAFEEARRRDVPIFLSVGYSSCHWCHVMAHESFEDPEVAAQLNGHFVNVKVDREERPDVDAVYMDAVQAMTGRGGWPMSVFLTPDTLRPFYAGTYWPKLNRPGMPGFLSVIDAVAEAWRERRDQVLESADQVTERLTTFHRTELGTDHPDVDRAVGMVLTSAWDRDLGGFGRAPKFPQAMTIGLLLDHHAATDASAPTHGDALAAASQALTAMADGGIHDQLAGGFARYSTDAKWLVPHFEKMLYDNGLLLAEYARASVANRAVGNDAVADHLAEVATTTADYLLRELRHELGGFFAATDADSEGVEGKYFIWDRDELVEVLDEAGLDGDAFADLWNATDPPNWDGEYGQPGGNILHLTGPVPAAMDADLARAKQVLLDHRAQRVSPGLDDKVLTSWNALAIRGLAIAGRYLHRPDWVAEAAATAAFLDEHLVVDGVLHHTWKDGTATVPALLEDIAHLALALVELFQAGGDPTHLARARELVGLARREFHDEVDGAFFATAHDAEGLYRRPKDTWDNATPSSNSALALASLQLAALTGDLDLRDVADEILRTFARSADQSPPGHGMLLQAALRFALPSTEVAIVGPTGDDRDALVATVDDRLRPDTVLAVADAPDDRVPLLDGRHPTGDVPMAWVCHGFACDLPVTSPDDLRSGLDA